MKTLLISLLVVAVLLLPSCTSQEDLQESWHDGYQVGYDEGYNEGNNAGYDTGYDEGFDSGYYKAVKDFWDFYMAKYGKYVENNGSTESLDELLRKLRSL